MGAVIYLGPAFAAHAAQNALGEALQIARADHSSGFELTRDVVGIVDASLTIPIDESLLRHFPSLRAVSCASTGASHIDMGALDRRRIRLMTLSEDADFLRKLPAAAEHTWALILACFKNVVGASREVEQGIWARENWPGRQLAGKRLGLIGCGRIGQRIAAYATAFEMTVLGFDPHILEWPSSVARRSFMAVAKESDIVSIHVPLNSETRGLVDEQFLKAMRDDAVLINTSRGGVLDESALLERLKSFRLAVAALDVLQDEPEVSDSSLVRYARAHTNLIITPHIAGFSTESVTLAVGRASDKLRHFLQG